MCFLRVWNAGIDDGRLLTVDEGSYIYACLFNTPLWTLERIGPLQLAVQCLFETTNDVPTFGFELFTVKVARNDYEVCLITTSCLPSVTRFLGLSGALCLRCELRAQFNHWHLKMRHNIEPIKGGDQCLLLLAPPLASPLEWMVEWPFQRAMP